MYSCAYGYVFEGLYVRVFFCMCVSICVRVRVYGCVYVVLSYGRVKLFDFNGVLVVLIWKGVLEMFLNLLVV